MQEVIVVWRSSGAAGPTLRGAARGAEGELGCSPRGGLASCWPCRSSSGRSLSGSSRSSHGPKPRRSRGASSRSGCARWPRPSSAPSSVESSRATCRASPRRAIGMAHGFLAWAVALVISLGFQLVVLRGLVDTTTGLVVDAVTAESTAAAESALPAPPSLRNTAPGQYPTMQPGRRGPNPDQAAYAARVALDYVSGAGWSWFGTWFLAGLLAIGGALLGVAPPRPTWIATSVASNRTGPSSQCADPDPMSLRARRSRRASRRRAWGTTCRGTRCPGTGWGPDWAPALGGSFAVALVERVDDVHPLDDLSERGEAHAVEAARCRRS